MAYLCLCVPFRYTNHENTFNHMIPEILEGEKNLKNFGI